MARTFVRSRLMVIYATWVLCNVLEAPFGCGSHERLIAQELKLGENGSTLGVSTRLTSASQNSLCVCH